MKKKIKKNKLEKMLKAASFISLKATANTGILINQFPKYFRDIETQKQFYLDMLSLYLDIYHRLGAGLIKPDNDKNIAVKELDERIGTVAGIALAYINKQSEKSSFMKRISIELLQDTFGKFHNWSKKFQKIYDIKNALSVKFVSKRIVGFSIKGENTLVINFVAKQVEKLSIKEDDLDKFIFYLSDLTAQYLNDPRFKDILNIG